MSKATGDDLELHLLRIEKSLRRWKRTTASFGLLLAALSGAVAMLLLRVTRGAPETAAKEIVAQRFVAVDSHGNRIATFGEQPDGIFTGLTLLPPLRPTTSAVLESAETSLLEDLASHHGTLLAVAPDGSAFLALRGYVEGKEPDFSAAIESSKEESSINLRGAPNESGATSRISLSASGSLGSNFTEAHLSLLSREKRSLSLDASDDYVDEKSVVPGEASITAANPINYSNKPLVLPEKAVMMVRSDGSAEMHLDGTDSKPSIQLSADSESNPRIQLFDLERTLRAVLGSAELETIKTGATEKTATSSLTLFDKTGKVSWQTP